MKKIYIITCGLLTLLSLAAVTSASGSDKIEVYNEASMNFRGYDSTTNLQISAHQSPWWMFGDYITISYTIPDPNGEGGYIVYMADHVPIPVGSVSINSGLHKASIHYPGLVLTDGVIEKIVDIDVTWTGDKIIEKYHPKGSVKDQYGNIYVFTGKWESATLTGSISGDLNLDVSKFATDMNCDIYHGTYRSTPVM